MREAFTGSQDEAGDDTEADKNSSTAPKKLVPKLAPSALAGFNFGRGPHEFALPKPVERLGKAATGLPERPTVDVTAEKHDATTMPEPSLNLAEVSDGVETTIYKQDTPEIDPLDRYESGRALGAMELNGGEVIDLQDHPPRVELLPVQPGKPVEFVDTEVYEPSQPVPGQPEQQHYAQAHEVEPPEPESAYVGDGGELPPPLPPTPPDGPRRSFEEPPEPELPPAVDHGRHTEATPLEPAAAYRRYMSRMSSGGGNVQVVIAPTKGAESLVQAVGDMGFYRGVILGGAVVWWLEHRKHKKHERKLNKEIRTIKKENIATRANAKFAAQQHEQQQAETLAQLHGAQEGLASAQKRTEVEAQRLRQVALEAQERIEVPPENRWVVEGAYGLEKDIRTGRAAENQTVAHGQEFYNDQAPETATVRKRDAVASGAASLAVGASAGGGTSPTSGPAATAGGTPLPYTTIPNATMQGLPQYGLQPMQDATKKDAAASATGPIWPWVLALLAVAIALIVVLG